MQNGLDYTSLVIVKMVESAAKDEILRPIMATIATLGMEIAQKRFDTYIEAYLMASKKDYDGAIILLKSLPDDDIHAKAFLGAIYRESGRANLYTEELEEICKQHKNSIYLMSSLGRIREGIGDFEGAIKIEENLVQKIEKETEPIKRRLLLVSHYNLAGYHYRKEERNENPDFSKVYEYLEAVVAEKEMCGLPLGYLIAEVKKDIKKEGYFVRLKDEKRFKDLAKRLR